jgi:hypothetical protein
LASVHFKKGDHVKIMLAAGCLAAAMSAAAPCPVRASPQSAPVHHISLEGSERSAEAIEAAFWMCDYVATTRGMQFVSLDVCAAITELIKSEKFGGDYDEMVEWWRSRKPEEHLKLELDESR